MILDIVQGDVLATEAPVIFAINYEGFNDSGFAGVVHRRFWPGLAALGRSRPGQVHRHTSHGRIFFGVACHELRSGKWDMPAITTGLDEIAAQLERAGPALWPTGFEQARRQRHLLPGSVWMGRGLIGALTEVDPTSTLTAMARSVLPLSVYYL